MRTMSLTPMGRARMRIWTVLLIVGVALAGFGGVGQDVFGAVGAVGPQTGTPASPASGGVVREVLSSGNPAAAPGEVLELVRYTIPAGTLLPAHTHPGMQAATIESGTLHYTVLVGEVPVTRAAGSDPGLPDAVTAGGGEVAIGPGDAFVEAAGVAHYGRNAGPEPVVILVASLFTIGEPPAHLVEATPVAPPVALG